MYLVPAGKYSQVLKKTFPSYIRGPQHTVSSSSTSAKEEEEKEDEKEEDKKTETTPLRKMG